MKTFLVSLMIVLTSLSAHADKLSLFGGLNSTEFDGGGNWDREFGYEFGASYVKNFQPKFALRTGGGIVKKQSEFDAVGGSTDVEYLFLEIPATLMFAVTSQFHVFGGFNLDITLADDGTRSESFALNLPLGVRYNIEGPHSIEGIFEFGITDIAKSDVKIGNSLSVRYLYDFTVQFR